MKSASPFVVRMAMWVKHDPAWMHALPPSVRMVLSVPFWLARYSVGYILMVLIVSLGALTLW